MHQLKDIAVRMDNCHVRTAKRWWKKLRVPPDVRGHGPHRWKDATADKLISLWELYYATRGTTPQITRAKFAGKFTDDQQPELLSWTPKIFTPPTGKKLPPASKLPPAGNANAAGIRTKLKPRTS